MRLFLELVGVGILILLNAFFVAAEYGLVTARRTRIIELHHQGDRRARQVLRITGDPPRFIAAMQLGVTLTSLAIGALGEQALARAFEPALGHADRTALWVSAPVRAFFAVFRPLIWLLQRATEVVLRVFGLEPPGAEGDPLSEAELKLVVQTSTQHGEIEEQEQEMVYRVFDFADKEVSDVMVPRPEVVAISIDLPPEEALAVTLEAPYTRYPVYSETIDNVIGTLHVRDLFQALHDKGFAAVDLRALLRAPYVVPETKDLAALLAEFRRTNQHMAVVVDEYGGMEGIVTLEDLLEEIVGEIEDEFDLPDESVEHVDEDTIRIDGTFPIDDFNERFGTELPVEDYHTVAGFVFGQLGRAAEVGDDVRYDGLRFDVLEVEGSRIGKIAVTFEERPVQRADALDVADELE